VTISPTLARPAGSISRVIPLVAGVLALAATALVAGFVLTDPRGLRVLLAAALVVVFAGTGFIAPRRLVYTLSVWLVVLGFLRRLISEWSPAQGPADLLLLVDPAAILILFLVAARSGAFRHRTIFANALLALSVLVVLGALNPLQGSLTAGLAGLLFVLVPTLGFWVGRVFCDDRTLSRILVLVAVFSVAEALYGLTQTFGGFPRWDSAWIATHQDVYAALYVGDYIRPFASFSSFAEYSYFLAIGLVVWIALAARRGLFLLALSASLLLAVGIFYASTRIAIVALVAALGLTIAARRRLPIGVAALVTASLLLVVPIVARHFEHTGSGAGVAGSLASHQIGGLANPLDPQQSTLGNHVALLKLGLVSAFHNPIGNGIGGVTIAGAKFGGVEQSTEADPSNVAVALGLPGLLTYLVLVVTGFRQTYGLAVRRHEALAYVALAVITLTFLQWLNGGQYSIAFLLWLIFGWVDRSASGTGRLPKADQADRLESGLKVPPEREVEGK
jgi:hypothetical protein